eukprot:sb/3462642/
MNPCFVQTLFLFYSPSRGAGKQGRTRQDLIPPQMQDIKEKCSELSLSDVNYLLYRCAGEERVDGCGGVYGVPGHGDLPYAGIVGFLSVLKDINTSHPFYRNITEGWWPVDYTVNRIKHLPLGQYLATVFGHLRQVPDYMRCKVFSDIIHRLYKEIRYHVGNVTRGDMTPGCYGGCHGNEWSEFELDLVMTSLQMLGRVGKCGVPAARDGSGTKTLSMAAGLPHFSHGFMRCWGRDTFIALPGLLLACNRLQEAKDIVLGFARTLRYGLIPNLLSEGGERPRYNCRDAVWWWCRCVVLICERDPFFSTNIVHRNFSPKDDTPLENECTVLDCVQEVIERHLAGITFTEERAGPELDEHLKYEGFLSQAGFQCDTGFVFGGSRHNCGTWMDKVGSSDMAVKVTNSPCCYVVVLLVKVTNSPCCYVVVLLVKFYFRWCRCVVLICERDPSFSTDIVHRNFSPKDDTPLENECTVLDCVQEVIERHLAGITFTEERAGPELDEHLKYEGFLIQAGFHRDTGFVFGGSRHNCGTWMDKVGSSDMAGNRGIPATPRDGSAIELVGLSYLTLKWLNKQVGVDKHGYGFSPLLTGLPPSMNCLHYVTVEDPKTSPGYAELISRIEGNFERCFWTGSHYKDTYGGVGDGQLRPNQCVTMAIAPGGANDTGAIIIWVPRSDFTGARYQKSILRPTFFKRL